MSNTRESRVNDPNDVQLTDLSSYTLRTIAEFTPAGRPLETMRLMSLTNQSLNTLFKPDLLRCAVQKALALAADASVEAIPKLLEMLDQNPKLLLTAGNVVTRSGLIVENVTVYEFLLGAGDPELAEQVAAFFAKFEEGEAAEIKQYAKYKPYIDGMLQQEPNDLIELIETIKKASPEEVRAALDKKPINSALNKALEAFRRAVDLEKITQPQMHYNYEKLIYAYKLYCNDWENFFLLSGHTHDMLYLIWRQVIGYLQRGLPAFERFVFAMGLYNFVENKKPLARTTHYQPNYQYGAEGSFPDLASSSSSSTGLGFDYGITFGNYKEFGGPGDRTILALQNLFQEKASSLQKLCRVRLNIKKPRT